MLLPTTRVLSCQMTRILWISSEIFFFKPGKHFTDQDAETIVVRCDKKMQLVIGSQHSPPKDCLFKSGLDYLFDLRGNLHSKTLELEACDFFRIKFDVDW